LPDKGAFFREGISARAVVVRIARCDSENVLPVARTGQRELTLRIPLDDGSRLDVVRPVSQADIGDWISVGDVLPIWYDADDHSRVEVDPSLAQERLDDSIYTPLGTWHPIERLRRLTDLRDHGLLDEAEFTEAQAQMLTDD
jgi:hypothetical protein